MTVFLMGAAIVAALIVWGVYMEHAHKRVRRPAKRRPH